MKVLSYLEYSTMPNNVNQREAYYWFVRYNFNDDQVGDITNIYAQPFSLELVNKLFDCTNYDGKIYLEINDIPIQIIEYRKVEGYKAIRYGDFTFEFSPKTIDDFITDTKRAGIELKWRTK